MPIYEFLCPDCRRIYSFMAATTHDGRQPRCPRCGNDKMVKQVSRFAFVRGGTEPLAAIPKPAESQPTPADDEAPTHDDGLYLLWDVTPPK
jgi:putative FmdB family regulatory protein